MNARERVRAIVAGVEADRTGFWLGNPDPATWPRLHRYFGSADEEELRRRLGDDLRWINPGDAYRHPEGRPTFDIRPRGEGLGVGGALADCERVETIDAFDWPDPEHLDFAAPLERLDAAGDAYRASGFWCPFFHVVADLFGMENLFVRMLTHPEVVHAAMRRVVGFYLEANRRFYAQAGDRIDGFFFGNDFGTQRDLLLGPELLAEFVFPYMAELIRQARDHGYGVICHCCGAVGRIIPDLIAMGVDALHPLQARAVGMDAESLAAAFGGQIAFIGGIDTQVLLVRGTPAEVAAEVQRVKALLGPRLVVSPSHEALLPDVPPENVEAMARAV